MQKTDKSPGEPAAPAAAEQHRGIEPPLREGAGVVWVQGVCGAWEPVWVDSLWEAAGGEAPWQAASPMPALAAGRRRPPKRAPRALQGPLTKAQAGVTLLPGQTHGGALSGRGQAQTAPHGPSAASAAWRPVAGDGASWGVAAGACFSAGWRGICRSGRVSATLGRWVSGSGSIVR